MTTPPLPLGVKDVNVGKKISKIRGTPGGPKDPRQPFSKRKKKSNMPPCRGLDLTLPNIY